MASALVPLLTRLGAPDPVTGANAIMACCEGVILHRIARDDDTDPRPMVNLVVRAATGHTS
jgi:hypothetical protein